MDPDHPTVFAAQDGERSHLRSVHTVLPTRDYLVAMWERRSFAIEMPLEELRTAHRTTLLGNLWHLINPALLIGVYYLVFGTILAGERPDNFLVWLTIGLFSFRLTQGSVLGAAGAIEGKAGLMRSLRFPRALIPASVVTGELLAFGLELAVVILLVLGSGFGFSPRWFVLPIILIVHTAFNLGFAMLAARVTDAFRDARRLLPFVFQLLLYLSGVLVPIDSFLTSERVPVIARLLLDLNPIATILDAYRWVFMGTYIAPIASVRTSLFATVLLLVGFRVFRTAEWRYGRA